MIAFGIIATVALRNWPVLVYLGQAAMLFAIIVRMLHKRRTMRIGLYAAWYGFFVLWCLLSTLWAVDPDSALSATTGVIQFVVLGAAIAAYIVAERSPFFLLDCLAWSAVVLVIVLVALTPLDAWQQALAETQNISSSANRIGATVQYHPNALARILAVGAFIWLYKLKKEKGRRLFKYIVIIALTFILLVTKSRLSVILFAALVLLFMIITARSIGKFIARLLLVLGVALILLWALYNVPVLYNTVGVRFEGLVAVDGAVDASTSTREEMSNIAFILFQRAPFTGVGFENFAYYYYYEFAGWTKTYAHNTISELSADLGIVGLISYYVIPVWSLGVLMRRFRLVGRAGRIEVSGLLVLALGQIGADFGSISYTSEYSQILTAVLYGCAVLAKSDRRESKLLKRNMNIVGNAHGEEIR